MKTPIGIIISFLMAPALATGSASSLFTIPSSIQSEHRELHATLERAQKEGGQLGEAAKALASRLGPHFEKEERLALPQLGLLPALAKGEVSPDMRKAIQMGEQLRAEYDVMLQEHRLIGEALQRFRTATHDAGTQDYDEFIKCLSRHAKSEEELLYPTAIVIGEYLRLRLDEGPASGQSSGK